MSASTRRLFLLLGAAIALAEARPNSAHADESPAGSSSAPEPAPAKEPLSSLARASFPLLEGAPPVELSAHASVFAQYVFAIRDDAGSTDWFHDVELPRAIARLDGASGDVRARLAVEAVRSATDGALLGVAGDSLVMRAREASATYTAFEHVEARMGLVPTMTIAPIEQLWGMRMIAPTGLERAGLASPADLGATLRGLLPGGFGWLGVGAYNGEGYDRRELNRGKNVEIAAAIRPLASIDTPELTVLASYVAGSSGTALARADRLSGGLGWEGDSVRGGATATFARGVGAASDVDGALVEGFVRVRPLDELSIGANALYFARDTSDADDWTLTVTGSAGWFFAPVFGLFLAVDGQRFGATAAQGLPGVDDVRARVVTALEL